MPGLREAVARGRIARRFDTALARGFAGKHILDYGCGDGTLLALAMMNDGCYPGTPPYSWPGPGLATQVWFIGRVRETRFREPAGGDVASARYGEAGSQ